MASILAQRGQTIGATVPVAISTTLVGFITLIYTYHATTDHKTACYI